MSESKWDRFCKSIQDENLKATPESIATALLAQSIAEMATELDGFRQMLKDRLDKLTDKLGY